MTTVLKNITIDSTELRQRKMQKYSEVDVKMFAIWLMWSYFHYYELNLNLVWEQTQIWNNIMELLALVNIQKSTVLVLSAYILALSVPTMMSLLLHWPSCSFECIIKSHYRIWLCVQHLLTWYGKIYVCTENTKQYIVK